MRRPHGAAFETIRARRGIGADFRGVVIYPLIRDTQEVLVGLSRDSQFGPVIAFGLGGIYTEVLRDVALRVAPIDRTEADAMIRSIRAFPILAGARAAAMRSDALADLLAQVSELPFRYPEIAELDLNPVFAGPTARSRAMYASSPTPGPTSLRNLGSFGEDTHMSIKPQRGLDTIKPYVPGKPIEEVQREYGLTDVIKLASNENPWGPSPKVMAALQAALPESELLPRRAGL